MVDTRVAAPGRYRLDWALCPGNVWGYFVRGPSSSVALHVDRLGTIRELYPGMVNPSSPNADQLTRFQVADTSFDLAEVTVLPSHGLGPTMQCMNAGPPRLVAP